MAQIIYSYFNLGLSNPNTFAYSSLKWKAFFFFFALLLINFILGYEITTQVPFNFKI